MLTRRVKFLLWLAIIALIMACVPTIAAPLPTANPNQVSLFIAQTANAASTQTAAALPTSTSTATSTPTPRNTATVTPTFTSTVIFILSSPTKPPTPTMFVIGGGGGSGGNGGSGGGIGNYSCQVVSVNPANGSIFNARDNFDAIWRITNNGEKDWDSNSVDFTYLSGARIHKAAGYDLGRDIRVGQTVDLGVDMVAPADAGTYTTTWTLSVGDRTFCNMSLTIVVR